MEAITRYGSDVEVVFQSHNWPHWGNETVNTYMEDTAAVYKFINDQTLLYINQGYTEDEIAHMIQLPEDMEKVWYTRQYYGTVAHDARAVYQKYMGWYDANPVNLDKLPLSESAEKYVEYLGDTDEVLKKARKDFDAGEYQWMAEITSVLIYADPENEDARYLCADALEQLGYQAESGTWRNAYLSGAKELREGACTGEEYRTKGNADQRESMTAEMMLDYMGISLDSNAAEDLNLLLNFKITDENENYLVTIKSGVLLYQKGVVSEEADATLTMPTAALMAITSGDTDQQQYIQVEGDADVLNRLSEYMVTFTPTFNIVEP